MNIEVPMYRTGTLSPERYLNLNERERANIESTKIIPAVLGEKGFGKIQVTYKSPVFELPFNE
ncbi:hypothetical protein BH10PSE19_BH10PSE19_02150 [soil metagenome]